jgi:predicted NodU family carbamoyl transferase
MTTLGFRYSRVHGSSACIPRDGEWLFAVAEERIDRMNHAFDFTCQGWLARRAIFATVRLPCAASEKEIRW